VIERRRNGWFLRWGNLTLLITLLLQLLAAIYQIGQIVAKLDALTNRVERIERVLDYHVSEH